MWYVMVTGPTIGYGDLFPTTVLGKLFGAETKVFTKTSMNAQEKHKTISEKQSEKQCRFTERHRPAQRCSLLFYAEHFIFPGPQDRIRCSYGLVDGACVSSVARGK